MCCAPRRGRRCARCRSRTVAAMACVFAGGALTVVLDALQQQAVAGDAGDAGAGGAPGHGSEHGWTSEGGAGAGGVAGGSCDTAKARWDQLISVYRKKRLPARFQRCALVGSSVSLVGQRRGLEIDSYDTVIRVNRLPAEEHFPDLGNKTDIYFASPGWPEGKGAKARFSKRGYHVEYVGGTFKRCNYTEGSGQCGFGALVMKGSDLYVAGRPWRKRFPLDKPGWKPRSAFPVGYQNDFTNALAFLLTGLRGAKPTNGFHALITFLPLCTSLHLYGFRGQQTFDRHKFDSKNHKLSLEHALIDRMARGGLNQSDWKESPRLKAKGFKRFFKRMRGVLIDRSTRGCMTHMEL